jgi:hypothetical protein
VQVDGKFAIIPQTVKQGAPMSFIKQILQFLLFLLAPVILVAIGAALTAWGLSNDWQILTWTGLIVIAAGFAWGIFIWIWADTS